MFISRKLDGAKLVAFGVELNSPLGGLSLPPPNTLCARPCNSVDLHVNFKLTNFMLL